MVYENDIFKIFYNECDKEYISQVINELNSVIHSYLDFFSIDKLEDIVVIKFYDSLDDFKIYYEERKKRSYDGKTVGRAEGNKIHMLSFKERIKVRPNDTLVEFIMGIKHELVHICHIAYKGNSHGTWFAEELATNLGSPRYEETLDGCTLEELLHKSKYKYCYTLAKYMLENYTHEQILEYAYDDNKLLKDTDKILEEAKEYYRHLKL